MRPKNWTPKKPRPSLVEEKSSVKATSMENEKRLSKKLKFKLTPGSGNTPRPSRKGDGQTDQFMIECKETTAARISINETVIGKLCREALAAGKDPVLILSAYGLPEPIPKDWVVFPAYLFEEIGL